jgi:hypothetical protein
MADINVQNFRERIFEMGSRGRRSAAELSAVMLESKQVSTNPPSELSDAQAAVWRDAVSSMRGDKLARGAYPILVAYCRHVCRARMLESLISAFKLEAVKEDLNNLPYLDKLLAMAERETRAATACARALRLTPQSIMHARTAGRPSREFTGRYVGQDEDEARCALNDHKPPWD